MLQRTSWISGNETVRHGLLFFPRNNASVRVDVFVPKLILNAFPNLFPEMMLNPLCWRVKVIDW
jgi:hypothetical protein